MSLAELLALRDHIAELRAAGAKGTLHRQIKAFIANLERETAQAKGDATPKPVEVRS